MMTQEERAILQPLFERMVRTLHARKWEQCTGLHCCIYGQNADGIQGCAIGCLLPPKLAADLDAFVGHDGISITRILGPLPGEEPPVSDELRTATRAALGLEQVAEDSRILDALQTLQNTHDGRQPSVMGWYFSEAGVALGLRWPADVPVPVKPNYYG